MDLAEFLLLLLLLLLLPPLQSEQKENRQFCCPGTAGQWPGCSAPNQPFCSGEMLGTRGALEPRGLLAAEASQVIDARHLCVPFRNASLG